MKILLLSLGALALLASCQAGNLTVTYAPSSLQFLEASALRSSSLDDVIAVAMGYTPETSSWNGLVVTSPFNSPAAALVLSIDASGAEVPLKGIHYSVQEDLPLQKVFDSLNSTVSSSAQRPTHFLSMEVSEGVSAEFVTLPDSASSLKKDKEPDSAFLLEMGALPSLVDRLKTESSVSHGGQDFTFFLVESFSLLVKTYGDGSPQVREGKQLLEEAMKQLVANARHLYKDEVLVISLVLDNKASPSLSRKTRQAAPEVDVDSLNLAKEYSTDYPAMFNIILFLSIVLAISVLAAAAATAYMDPGRDSIIYRMTNPKMKKDQ